MSNKEFSTTDIFGKPICFKDLKVAIQETKKFVGFSKSKEIHFEHITQDKKTKVTGEEYYSDLLKKLKNIQ